MKLDIDASERARKIGLHVERVRDPYSEDQLADLRAWISTALEHDYERMSVWECLARIDSGEYGLMVVRAYGELQAVLVVTVRQIHARHKALHVVACGGSMLDQWLVLALDELRAWALDEKCTAITLCGREGWERVLRAHEYKRQSIFMVRELDNERQ